MTYKQLRYRIKDAEKAQVCFSHWGERKTGNTGCHPGVKNLVLNGHLVKSVYQGI